MSRSNRLTDLQLGGRACLVCSASRAPMVPVATVDGSQVSACRHHSPGIVYSAIIGLNGYHITDSNGQPLGNPPVPWHRRHR